MKAFIQKQLAKKAKKLVEQHKPLIIGVTGSVGKTSTRNAIATLLSAKYTVAKNIKNYNNEFGLPLTILGKVSPKKSIMGWLSVLFAKYESLPQVYVLEYGVDRPGDMKELCDIVSPSIAVMTAISPVHAEQFASVESLLEEKAHLLACVPSGGLCVLNADDNRVIGASGHASASVLTYGFSPQADVRASDYQLWTREDFSFEPGETFSEISVQVHTQDQGTLAMKLENMLGKTSVTGILAAVAIAKHLGLTDEQILSKIGEIKAEPGRMNPIAGIKGSLIIDSTYNAAPASMAASLDVLKEFTVAEGAKRIAVLGTMAELGRYSDDAHRQVGMRASEVADWLITVGEPMLEARRAAIEAGMDEDHTEHFSDAEEAGRWLDRNVKKGDVVLVKGSRSMAMERTVKDIMAEPMNAPQLLCST